MEVINQPGLAISVDELGAINAQIKALQDQASVLKDFIIANSGGAKEVRGNKYKARIVVRDESERVGYKGVAMSLQQYVSDSVWGQAVESNKSLIGGSVSVSLYDL